MCFSDFKKGLIYYYDIPSRIYYDTPAVPNNQHR